MLTQLDDLDAGDAIVIRKLNPVCCTLGVFDCIEKMKGRYYVIAAVGGTLRAYPTSDIVEISRIRSEGSVS